jgi:hypothetical protein
MRPVARLLGWSFETPFAFFVKPIELHSVRIGETCDICQAHFQKSFLACRLTKDL